jgi:hypothetical protein
MAGDALAGVLYCIVHLHAHDAMKRKQETAYLRDMVRLLTPCQCVALCAPSTVVCLPLAVDSQACGSRAWASRGYHG